MPLDGVIFDMDGVLSRTQTLHARAESRILEKACDVEMAPGEITRRYAGMPLERLFAEQASTVPDDLQQRKQEQLSALVAEDGIRPVPGAPALLADLDDAYILGVASASSRPFIQQVLQELGIADYFAAVTSTDAVPRGKPAPDVFLATAERMEVDPAHCLVIEDGAAGMEGAVAAGMVAVGLVDDPGDASPAHETTPSLTALDGAVLERIHDEHAG